MTADRLLEPLIGAADRALRSIFAPSQALRPHPAPVRDGAEPELSDPQARHAAGLMRINHSGEMAAQALYHGQALLARNSQTRAWLLKAASEETDHLAWCETRLTELGSRPSLLAPLWYAASFAIGAAAAALGDRVSLGFVAETERQVEGHLNDHLDRLPPNDSRSRVILQQMKEDEQRHGEQASQAGATELPAPLKRLMFNTSRVMTVTSYWI